MIKNYHQTSPRQDMTIKIYNIQKS